MKNYFPHDSDARSDDKIIALRIKHKWEGYGLYWALIEKLRESKDYTLKADYNVLAFDLRSDAALIKSVINDFGLFAFTDNGECFYSESLNIRMKPLDEKRAKLSNAGKRGNEKRWKGNQYTSPPDNNSIATQSQPDHHPIANQSQEDIKKEDNTKESPNGDKKEAGASSPVSSNLDYLKFNDWLKRKAPFCSNPKNFSSQITEFEFLKLKEKYTGKQIADIIEQIENRKDLRKRYTNLYRTVLNWAKKEYGS